MSEPCLCLFIKTSGSECLIGAANLAPSATEWDNKHIQEQILVSQKDRVEDMLKREEFDLDTYDFSDSPNLCSLESLLVRLAPTRVLYCCTGGKTLLKQLEQVFQGSNIDNLEAVPQKFFNTDSVENDVRRLIGVDGPSHDLQNLSGDRKLAGAALAALVRKNNLMYDETKYGRFHLGTRYLNQYVRLDAAAARALNLFPEPRSPKNSSLFGILDHCQTRMGSALLHRWIRHPLVDLEQIERRHALVGIFHSDSSLRETLRQDQLKGVPDLSRIVVGLKRGTAALKDLWALRGFAQKLPGIVETLETHDGDETSKEVMSSTFSTRLRSLLEEFQLYMAFTSQAIDLEQAALGHLRVNPNLSTELRDLNVQIADVEERVDQYLNRTLPSRLPDKIPESAIKQDKPGKHDDGWSLRVNKSFEKHLPQIPGYREIKTVKAGVVFTTNKLRGLNEELHELQDEYDEKAKQFLKQAVSCAVSYLPVIELATVVLSELDVFVSLGHSAAYAMGGEYCRPKMTALGKNGNIKLKQARHPCMEALDNMNFIPNDYELDRETSRFVIVTGPNMGGKSTYIRQLGVIAIMAQIGSFVPADYAELPVVDSVLARVGAGDAQLKGISTFMAEMLEAGAIIEAATIDSLILVDELGRGTSTYDGFGLAWAIGEQIVQKGSMCMFATHFHELTALADDTEGVSNLHATVRHFFLLLWELLLLLLWKLERLFLFLLFLFSLHLSPAPFFFFFFFFSIFLQAVTTKTSITMKYELQPGPCDRSFGIHVAELAQFPADVVEQARFKARELENLGGPGMEAASSRPAKRQKNDQEEEIALQTFLQKFVEGNGSDSLVSHVEALVSSAGGKSLQARLVGKLASP